MRRNRIGEDGRRPAARALDEPADRKGRTERVRVGVLVADGEDVSGRPDPVDDGVRHRLGP